MHDRDRRVRDTRSRVESCDRRVIPAGDLPEEDSGEHRAGQVQPGARREVQVIGHAFASQGDRHLRDAASPGCGLLGGGHGHIGGAEVGLPGGEGGGTASATAHDGITDAYPRMQLVVFAKAAAKKGATNVEPAPVRVGLWPPEPTLTGLGAELPVVVAAVEPHAATARMMIAPHLPGWWPAAREGAASRVFCCALTSGSSV